MNMGILATIAGQKPSNFVHFLMDNECYATTGGQPVPNAQEIDYAGMAKEAGYSAAYNFDNLEDFATQCGKNHGRDGARIRRHEDGPGGRKRAHWTPPGAGGGRRRAPGRRRSGSCRNPWESPSPNTHLNTRKSSSYRLKSLGRYFGARSRKVKTSPRPSRDEGPGECSVRRLRHPGIKTIQRRLRFGAGPPRAWHRITFPGGTCKRIGSPGLCQAEPDLGSPGTSPRRLPSGPDDPSDHRPGRPVGDLLRIFSACRVRRPLTPGATQIWFGRQLRPWPRLAIINPAPISTFKSTYPWGMGLGGGSSDAAAALLSLNQIWGLGLSIDELSQVAAGLGSDVAFFLRGGTALAEGRGEIIDPLSPLPSLPVTLICPGSTIPNKTSRMYSLLTPAHYSDGGVTRRMMQVLVGGGFTPDLMYNVFEAVAWQAFPDLSWLYQRSGGPTSDRLHLCGAGPAWFTLPSSEDEFHRLSDALQPYGVGVYLVNTVTPGSSQGAGR